MTYFTKVFVGDKEKVGAVGRTGAGKSSLVAALFRMPEPEGEVMIQELSHDVRCIQIDHHIVMYTTSIIY